MEIIFNGVGDASLCYKGNELPVKCVLLTYSFLGSRI